MCLGGDKELSKLVQIALFKCGYKWNGYTNTAQAVKYVGKQYLYVSTDGYIHYGSDPVVYRNSSNKILSLSKAKKLMEDHTNEDSCICKS